MLEQRTRSRGHGTRRRRERTTTETTLTTSDETVSSMGTETTPGCNGDSDGIARHVSPPLFATEQGFCYACDSDGDGNLDSDRGSNRTAAGCASSSHGDQLPRQASSPSQPPLPLPSSSSSRQPLTYARCYAQFLDDFVSFLEDFKSRAFRSSFIEPARLYYNRVGNLQMRDSVDLHGFNWYLSLLQSTLGFSLPTLPEYSSTAMRGVCDFWKGLGDDAWTDHFALDENFGLDFESMPTLRSSSSSSSSTTMSRATRKQQPRVKRRVRDNELPEGVCRRDMIKYPKMLGNMAITPNAPVDVRKKLAVYVSRFASFFTRDFFVKRFFMAIYASGGVDNVGACDEIDDDDDRDDERAVMDHLYRLFTIERRRSVMNTPPGSVCEDFPESITDFIFCEAPDEGTADDVVSMTTMPKMLNIDRAEELLVWLGVIRRCTTDVAANDANRSNGDVTSSALFETLVESRRECRRRRDNDDDNDGEEDGDVDGRNRISSSTEMMAASVGLQRNDAIPGASAPPAPVQEVVDDERCGGCCDADGLVTDGRQEDVDDADDGDDGDDGGHDTIDDMARMPSDAIRVTNDADEEEEDNETEENVGGAVSSLAGAVDDENGEDDDCDDDSGVAEDDGEADAATEVRKSQHCYCPICFELRDDVEVR